MKATDLIKGMYLKWPLLIILYTISVNCEEQLTLLSKTHSTHLDKYYGYADTLLLHFKVPENTRFVSFKFHAEETALSLFACQPQDISVFLKAGAPPVINPDGSTFPKHFLTEGRPDIYSLKFRSDKTYQYINLTSPESGSYFAAIFKSYTDPKLDRITQSGLTADCLTFLNVFLYTERRPPSQMIIPHKPIHVILKQDTDRLFKFYSPESADIGLLKLTNFVFCESCDQLTVRIKAATIPTRMDHLYEIHLLREEYQNKSFQYHFLVQETASYFIDYMFENTLENITVNDTGEFIFQLDFFSAQVVDIHNKTVIISERISDNKVISSYGSNNLVLYRNGAMRKYGSKYLDYNIPYKQYNLVREGRSESFMYSFDLPPDSEGLIPLAINITSHETNILKFHINTGLDVGGTLQFGLAFKPRLKTIGSLRKFENEPEHHTIIGCLRNGAKAIPTWPDKCAYDNELKPASIILNKTAGNSTIFVPFPEPGDWYPSFKLFCGYCEPCTCSTSCKKSYSKCSKQCEEDCHDMKLCNSCINNCENEILRRAGCSGCNCEGPCQKPNTFCDTSVIFIVESFPCVSGKCGKNGRCMFVISEGLAYSICVCSNNYRGWDCSDDSQANSYAMIFLELMLLVLSNLPFLPAAYVAVKRKYYVEAVVYFSTCFFSSFYHACDAGENVISFCLVRLAVLQFSDFFCGLLSIWVTLIAVAYIESPWSSVCHIAGAICLAFGTSINKQSIWVFIIPFITGIIIVAGNWYYNYRKGTLIFPTKKYFTITLPLGAVVAGVGLLMYSLLQTQSNYKYIHSIWHICMAVVIIILLPIREEFMGIPVSDTSE